MTSAGAGRWKRYPWATAHPSSRQVAVLALGLDSFGNDAEVQCATEGDDGGGDGGVGPVVAEAGDEGTIDMDLVEGEAA